MSFVLTISAMVIGWMIVASAMLWGMLRIVRRHSPIVSSGTGGVLSRAG
jgi:hypothetical protein